MTDENEQKIKDDGRRVEAFLADPAVKDALQRVHDGIYADFKNAQSSAQIEAAWAKSKALDAIADELVRVKDNGKLVEMKQAMKEELDARQKAVLARRNGSKR